ncbi:hypothetical protein [Kitasatospora sp. NRRL B-11411]|uniref:hypothetical protein n=1 Tax=Kitasatospora sp. NRRL B-11411 TaxID=1463822 RepID=UPI00068D84D3|nr:hypothetical protein [Kitasatospora sp. NRRL B-11411]
MPKIIRVVRTIDDPRLEVGLPSKTFRENRKWLKSAIPGKEIRPDWDSEARCWRVAKANFADLVRAMADKYGTVRVMIEYNPKMVCTESCRNAQGDDCACSCLGRSHGGGRWLEGWKDLGEIAVGHEGRTRIAYDVRREPRTARPAGQAVTTPSQLGPEQWYCPTDDQWSDADDWTKEMEGEEGFREFSHYCPNGHWFNGATPRSFSNLRVGAERMSRARPAS